MADGISNRFSLMIPPPVHLLETQQVVYEKTKALTGVRTNQSSQTFPTLLPVRMPEQETLAIDMDPSEPPNTVFSALRRSVLLLQVISSL